MAGTTINPWSAGLSPSFGLTMVQPTVAKASALDASSSAYAGADATVVNEFTATPALHRFDGFFADVGARASGLFQRPVLTTTLAASALTACTKEQVVASLFGAATIGAALAAVGIVFAHNKKIEFAGPKILEAKAELKAASGILAKWPQNKSAATMVAGFVTKMLADMNDKTEERRRDGMKGMRQSAINDFYRTRLHDLSYAMGLDFLTRLQGTDGISKMENYRDAFRKAGFTDVLDTAITLAKFMNGDNEALLRIVDLLKLANRSLRSYADKHLKDVITEWRDVGKDAQIKELATRKSEDTFGPISLPWLQQSLETKVMPKVRINM